MQWTAVCMTVSPPSLTGTPGGPARITVRVAGLQGTRDNLNVGELKLTFRTMLTSENFMKVRA
jgi:hypothetical protein